MNHSDSHDPILGDEWSEGCSACLAARNSTFAQLRKVVGNLGPYDTDEFIVRMQEAASGYLQLVRLDVPITVDPPRPYDWAEKSDFDAVG